MTLAYRLEGLLWPERFPPGHPRHDPTHDFWDGHDGRDDDDVYEWGADTIEEVAELVTQELESI